MTRPVFQLEPNSGVEWSAADLPNRHVHRLLLATACVDGQSSHPDTPTDLILPVPYIPAKESAVMINKDADDMVRSPATASSYALTYPTVLDEHLQ